AFVDLHRSSCNKTVRPALRGPPLPLRLMALLGFRACDSASDFTCSQPRAPHLVAAARIRFAMLVKAFDARVAYHGVVIWSSEVFARRSSANRALTVVWSHQPMSILRAARDARAVTNDPPEKPEHTFIAERWRIEQTTLARQLVG